MNLNARLEKLENAGRPKNVPAWVKALINMYGGEPEDYMEGGVFPNLEELIAGSMDADADPVKAG